MPASTVKRNFRTGVLHAIPFLLVVAPFAMLFGVVATEAGLPLLETMAMTSLVIAGASQFTALQLMSDGAGVAMAAATALAVNMRMAMFSAALTPHLGAAPLWQRAFCAYLLFDANVVLALKKFEEEPELPLRDRVAYYMGTAIVMGFAWIACSALGAVLGKQIPEAFALDFALPITFLAIVAPALKTIAHVAAAATSVVLALALSGLPAGIGLLIAALGAMLVGAGVETWKERMP